jgi:glycosyltransferase involved in cell wall biosynthesis
MDADCPRAELHSVIYNGRTPTSFLPHMSKEVSAVSVGRIWDLGKNSTLLTKIDPAVLVYLAGPNQEPENPMNRKNMAHSAKVRFWGVQSEKQLRLLYGKASIYIATSRYEPFGLAPLEAALSRCAILASDIPTFKEIWGDCAFYFKNNDPGSLEEALKQLSSDQELCATYAHLAYERARSRFTASRMVDEYLHLYSALVPTGVMAA